MAGLSKAHRGQNTSNPHESRHYQQTICLGNRAIHRMSQGT